MKRIVPLVLLILGSPALADEKRSSSGHGHRERPAEPAGVWFEGEDRLANVRQITFGGQNAEAYWSPDGSQLIFQATPEGAECDQIFTVPAEGGEPALVSSGSGRTTCAYFLTGTDRILYSSTHETSGQCPARPDYSEGYVWPLYPSYEIYSALSDGSDARKLTDNDCYDAEATVSPDGEWVVFTSTRDEDIEIYKMRPDGSDVTRLTHAPGYDGGPFFSPDGNLICFRAARPEGEELEEFRRLLAKDLVRPSALELYVMNADGTNVRQVTENDAANFAPFFTPDGEHLIFSSNLIDGGRNFDLFLIALDGSGLERVTTCTSFDSFPMFSPDGTKLAFASNRNGSVPGETNVFVADWVAELPTAASPGEAAQ